MIISQNKTKIRFSDTELQLHSICIILYAIHYYECILKEEEETRKEILICNQLHIKKWILVHLIKYARIYLLLNG